MKKNTSTITGHLDISIGENEEINGQIIKWQEVLIHGDPEGLKSFAQILIKIVDTNQDEIRDLPIDAREHMHLQPNFDTSKTSVEVVLGRIDAKKNWQIL